MWGGQLEAGASATSYIKADSGSSVTRTADLLTTTSLSWYNQTNGTVFVEFSVHATPNAGGGFPNIISFDAGANERHILFVTESDPNVAVFVTDGGVNLVNEVIDPAVGGTIHKVAYVYKLNDVAATLDGGTVVTDTGVTMPTVTTLRIGSRYDSAEQLNGHIRRVRYWPRRISDAEMQTITT